MHAFFIYMINLPDKFNSIYKILAEDTSLFFPIHDEKSHQNKLNNDLYKINKKASSGKNNFKNLIVLIKPHSV